jgi:4-hydroxybenzoate polyprenyltransferase
MKALRVHQWVKNVLIFLPMLLAHELTSPILYVRAVIAFFAFSFLASSIYVVNDLMDLHADQHHPRKQRRPFAAGNLSLLAAAGAVPLLILCALLLAQLLPLVFSVILLFYLLITTLYSWRLKQLVLLDVLTLAGLYITSEKVMQFYNKPALLWLICPLVLYWIGRIWHLAISGKLSDDPLEFAARDGQTFLLGLLGAAVLIWGSL